MNIDFSLIGSLCDGRLWIILCVDLDNQNNGKASMLRETIRLLGELATQMDSLKKENATLLSEYNYVRSLINATLSSNPFVSLPSILLLLRQRQLSVFPTLLISINIMG